MRLDPERNDPEFPIVNQQAGPCRHLRSPGIYLYADEQTRPANDDYDNTQYWCLKTLRSFGPDDEIVNRTQCGNASRNCYEPI
jgi:hypothetical protein